MHKFAELNSASAAQLFASYCATQGLDVQAVLSDANHAELFAASAQLPQIEQEFSRFLRQPSHARYQAAAWQHSKPDMQQSQADALPAIDWRAAWLQAPLTLAVLLLCLLVYCWQQIDWHSSSRWLQLTEPGQLWRWFTPMLLHFSLTHLVFNLAWWFYLGRQFEQRLGAGLLLNVSLSIALLSNAAQYFMVSPHFGGLSGVVYGLFGYFWIAGRINPAQGLFISPGLIGFMLLWLLLGFFDVLWVSMANWAHLGGLVTGMVWAWLLRHQAGRNKAEEEVIDTDI
ncbi:rhomboid family intramembrane serine protease GlpG [Rheinheimera maricola]|uniref:Rhomboid family intramembrane serine protease GlpG n=1 Tax=Rheinheimera maricola TaxID=2793282 RepID=A0ABS7X6V1_9GAMM|nr:rhomboid family intramembrane serine protease GlpG [Rheinheimera maricola]